MFTFTEAERTYLTENRGITTDAQGREVLVGLTFEETVFYMEYARQRVAGNICLDPGDGAKYLALHDKHEVARFSVIGAEVELRNDSPTFH